MQQDYSRPESATAPVAAIAAFEEKTAPTVFGRSSFLVRAFSYFFFQIFSYSFFVFFIILTYYPKIYPNQHKTLIMPFVLYRL